MTRRWPSFAIGIISKFARKMKIRYVFDFQNMVDAGNTGQRIANSRALIFIFRANLSQSVRLRFIKILTGNIRNVLKNYDETLAVVRHWDRAAR
jgi:hypothetical protein